MLAPCGSYEVRFSVASETAVTGDLRDMAVAGDLGGIQSTFTTKSGSSRIHQIYVNAEAQAAFQELQIEGSRSGPEADPERRTDGRRQPGSPGGPNQWKTLGRAAPKPTPPEDP